MDKHTQTNERINPSNELIASPYLARSNPDVTMNKPMDYSSYLTYTNESMVITNHQQAMNSYAHQLINQQILP